MSNRKPKLDADDVEFEKNFPDAPKRKILCATGKMCWVKRSRAESMAKQMRHQFRDSFIETYLCEVCGLWHCGHPKGTTRLRDDVKEQMRKK